MRKSDQSKLPELYMKLRDREKLARLMEIQGVSQHELAVAAGLRSHTYLGRMIRGQVTTGLQPKAAARIARYLGVPIDDLFVTKLSTDTAQTKQRRRAA